MVNIKLIGPIKNTDNKSRFGVQGPDLNEEDTLKYNISAPAIA